MTPKSKQQKFRYRTDPEYRRRAINCSRRYQDRLMESDPRWKLIFNLRKRISKIRTGIDEHMKKAAAFEKELIQKIKEKDDLINDLRRV